MVFNWITYLSILIVLLAVIKFWYLSNGRLYMTYRLDLVIFTLYSILETFLGLRDPSQWSVLFMNIVNFWAIIMAIKGIIRLQKISRLQE